MMAIVDLVLTVRGADGAAAVYRFAGPEVHVGRDAGCQVVLPDAAVSAQHARFVARAEGWQVLDAGSTHGSRLNGQPLGGEPRPVGEGDALAIGPFIIEVWFEEAGGLTTDSRDTERLARMLARSAATAVAGGWHLWVERGLATDELAPLAPDHPVWIGRGADSDLVVPEASLERQVKVVRTGTAVRFEGPAKWRGRTVEAGELAVEDRLLIGSAVIAVRGPAGTPPTDAPRPPTDRPGWTALEKAALVVGLAALAAAAWLTLA